jgi:hypothetical protein
LLPAFHRILSKNFINGKRHILPATQFFVHSLCCVLSHNLIYIPRPWFGPRISNKQLKTTFCPLRVFVKRVLRIISEPGGWGINKELCEISGSHGGEYEDGCLLGCSAV